MRYALWMVLVLAAVGCGSDRGPMMMTGPMGMGFQDQPGYSGTLVSVSPPGGSAGVPTSASFTMLFGAPMAATMEEYVDLHPHDISRPVVPMECAFSTDRLALTCSPTGPLDARTTYVLHLGGGMMTAAGQRIDYGPHGPGMGGQWLAGGMVGQGHGGHGWGMMGPGWRGANGGYGMEFPFTTA